MIVHGGRQSMSLNPPGWWPYSAFELTRDFGVPQNWTVHGANTLSLWYRGVPPAFTAISDSNIVMNGLGSNYGGTSDQGAFAYKMLAHDGSIIARIESLDHTNGWAKAGVMIRQSPDANSAFAFALATPTNGVHFQTRAAAEGMATSDSNETSFLFPEAQRKAGVPVWVRLERTGNWFSMYYSTEKVVTKWAASPSNPVKIEMGGPVCIGLAVSSHNPTTPAVSAFTAVATSGVVAGPWRSADIGVAQPVGQRGTFYVRINDCSAIVNSWPDARGASMWQQWNIPLTKLDRAGQSIAKITIGVSNIDLYPGRLYIDDIAFGRPAGQ
jgi:hypothetical protein